MIRKYEIAVNSIFSLWQCLVERRVGSSDLEEMVPSCSGKWLAQMRTPSVGCGPRSRGNSGRLRSLESRYLVSESGGRATLIQDISYVMSFSSYMSKPRNLL